MGKYLKMRDIFVNNITSFGYGIATTLFLAVVGTFGGLLIGIFLALGRTLKINAHDNKVVLLIKKFINFISYIYIQVFRGTPMMLQAMIFFFGIPLSWSKLGDHPIFNGYLLCGSIVIVLNTAAYIGEILRGGINSIDVGQEEGALSLGMTHFQAMFLVVVPQALKNSIPAIGNEFIVNIKDSSVLNVIGLTELFMYGKIIVNNTYKAIETYVILAIIYLFLTVVASLILKLIEKAMKGDIHFDINYFKHAGSLFGGKK